MIPLVNSNGVLHLKSTKLLIEIGIKTIKINNYAKNIKNNAPSRPIINKKQFDNQKNSVVSSFSNYDEITCYI